MPDLGSLLEREMQEIRPADYTIGDVARRRDRRRRNQRLRAATVALVIAVAAIGGLLKRSETSIEPTGRAGPRPQRPDRVRVPRSRRTR